MSHDGGTLYMSYDGGAKCVMYNGVAICVAWWRYHLSCMTEVPHTSCDGDVLYYGGAPHVILWRRCSIRRRHRIRHIWRCGHHHRRLGLDERRTFDVETEVVELRPNGSSDWIVVPQLVVVSMLMPRKDPRSRGGAGSLDVQHQSTQTTLYQVELTTQQPHVQQRQQVNNRSSVTIYTAFATSICSFPTETISK